MNSGLNDLRGAKCRIFGLGRSNEALISYLVKQGADIFVSDKRKSEKEITDILQKNGIKNAKILPYDLPKKTDFLFRTPFLRPDSKEITDNLALGARLSSEVELFLAKAKGKIYGITGSDGKTTTTTITYHLLKKKNSDNTYIGGNIGTPLISFIDKLANDSVTVCELSSFQLMTVQDSPHCSALTNITPNHLDWHKNMAEYIASKLKIFGSRTQKTVFSQKFLDSDLTPVYKKDIITFFAGENSNGVGITDGHISYFGEKLLDVSKIKLVGEHNVLNFMTAIALVYPEVTIKDIESVACELQGVEHRIELIAEKNGVKFYNSSIDSTPSRTLATLKCFSSKSVILICGGYDKNLDYDEFAVKSQKAVRKYVLCGDNKWKIYNSLITHGVPLEDVLISSSFFGAVTYATEVARLGEAVLLSPASASFDMFANFEERGIAFKNIIKTM